MGPGCQNMGVGIRNACMGIEVGRCETRASFAGEGGGQHDICAKND